VETAEKATPSNSEEGASARSSPASGNGSPVRLDPDLAFIARLDSQTAGTFAKCFQCGTCSAVCTISPDKETFPRKEMAWANWGARNLLMTDPNIWLCYNCQDCTTYCPRSARPGDVLSAVRAECIAGHSVPRFLGRWINQPRFLPLLLAIPALLLALALYLQKPLGEALGYSDRMGERIIFSYSAMYPHWLLNIFFFAFTALALLGGIIGVIRFWKALKRANPIAKGTGEEKGILPSLGTVLGKIFRHENFDQCTASSSRYWAHLCVFFGFAGLTMVTLWVITSGVNPIIGDDFVYPFAFLSPWKILANLGGLAVLAGCLLMINDRIKNSDKASSGSYADWVLLSSLLAVLITGFATEALHYVRLEPHRHIAYFVHLVFVGALLFYLPYSKLAHMLYRTVALTFVEHTGRGSVAAVKPEVETKPVEEVPDAG
jgi:quinone-modifying oxidoreductase subunit QmoC